MSLHACPGVFFCFFFFVFFFFLFVFFESRFAIFLGKKLSFWLSAFNVLTVVRLSFPLVSWTLIEMQGKHAGQTQRR